MENQVALSSEEKQMAMLAHLSAFAGFIIPFGNIIAPLVIWMLKKDSMPFASEQAKEAVNFQISMTIYFIVGLILMLVLIGIAIVAVLAVAEIILIVVAAMKANEGVNYRYPITIRIIK